MDTYIKAIYSSGPIDSGLVEFGVQYLEINPFYFRSGYIKEKILTKLKDCLLYTSPSPRD